MRSEKPHRCHFDLNFLCLWPVMQVRFFCLVGNSIKARSELGLDCRVQACTPTDGIHDGEPDPDLQLIFIASLRKSSLCGNSLPAW